MDKLSVQEIYKVLKEGGTSKPSFKEEDLKEFTTERKPSAIFVPSSMELQFSKLPKEVRDHYQAYGEQYYNRTIDSINETIDRRAKELLSAVKSGLSCNDLDDDEKVILRNQYGKEWFRLAGLEQEE